MTCAEIAARLERTLLRERDPEWLRAAIEHARQCPACAHLVKLHQLELRLSELPAVTSSSDLPAMVLARIAQTASLATPPSRGSAPSMFKCSAMIVGGFVLAVSYLVPAAGSSWLASLWPSTGPVRLPGLAVYFAQHPPLAILLAALAAALFFLGLVLPDRPVREPVRGKSPGITNRVLPAR
jgi:hypothetical protein